MQRNVIICKTLGAVSLVKRILGKVSRIERKEQVLARFAIAPLDIIAQIGFDAAALIVIGAAAFLLIIRKYLPISIRKCGLLYSTDL